MQFESANRENVVMQIWLGKQYLGQSDRQTTEVRQLPSLRDLTTAELTVVLNEYVSAQPEIAAEIGAIDADFEVEPGLVAKHSPVLDTPSTNTHSDRG